ncbi:MAG: hypothetical protein JWR12_3085 [Mucilaginibacter sp.]|nr:hypothetical protein [Mucilaginibacter sp.]
MRIEDVLKSPDILKNNYINIIKNSPFVRPSATNSIKSLEDLPTTHSFGYEKVFFLDEAKTITKSVFPAQNILFENKAFLSDKIRDSMRPADDPQPKRTMVKARDYGLDEFVFSYLGVHEYYYTQCEALNTPAFGAFFPAVLDDRISDTNVTLFDLESPLALPYKPEEMTLYPKDGRLVTENEIHNKYAKDFYEYWVCEEYEEKEFIDNNKWMQKREFHYKDKITVNQLNAILWPLDFVYDDDTNITSLNPVTLNEIQNFRVQNSEVEIYRYLWIGSEGYDRFTIASYLIGKHYYETGSLPSQKEFNDQNKVKFPEPIY